MAKALVYKLLFISWMMFVTFFSLFSFSDVDTSTFNIPHLDKAVHFTFYLVMVIIAFFAKTNGGVVKLASFKGVIYIMLFAILYGIVIEILQHMATTDRHGDILDALANSCGAIVGMFFIRTRFFTKPSLK
ncbi:VanZ family protein [Maribacter sp. MAR_2009_72]|uniref:VanZ family protein n=1 Tax=Maribacter sp. MAR_2009_72 TaxID=1250050 RepID=UPI00119B77F1|nr:VanZ family protein [Maribacter sp. MAR_2009_72]TVZ16734.1 VanZ like protein [Maribacter sp. MAR_2009_72]